MIYLDQDREEYNNEFRTMIQAFYHNEKVLTKDVLADVKVSDNQPKAKFTLEARFTDEKVALAIKEDGEVVLSNCAYLDDKDKKASRNAVNDVLYHMFVTYTGRELPWGDLTGVRPTKLATEMVEAGKSEDEVLSFFQEKHFTTRQKAEICLEVAKREHALLAGMDFREEYCLYVGIPFCPTRCLYCSFASYPLALYESKVDAYLDALEQEIIYAADVYKNKKLVSVYMGGGTPTSLTAKQMDRLLTVLFARFDMSKVREFTVEAGRPDSITRDKLEVLKKHGIDRISINPQTMHDETLKVIGRAHTVAQTKETFQMARELGFDNINMDMIVGLPSEELSHVEETLRQLKELAPDSLTVHSLAIKRAANLNAQMEEYRSMIKGSTNEMLLAVDDCARELSMVPYYLYRQKNIPGNLENIGYAREGKESIYNILIMEEKMDILALGAGASTKVIFHDENRIERAENVKSVDDYISRVQVMIERKEKLFATRTDLNQG